METNSKLEEEEYILGFNTGYVMAQYSPEIGELLPHITGKGIRLEGMKAGKEQYDFEKGLEALKDEKPKQSEPDKFRDYLPPWLRSPSEKDEPGFEPDKDFDIEPEH
jgi:hypothetical protein